MSIKPKLNFKFNERQLIETTLNRQLDELRDAPDDEALLARLKSNYSKLVDIDAKKGDEFAQMAIIHLDSFFGEWLSQALDQSD